MKDYNVYFINDCDWIVALSAEGAAKFWAHINEGLQPRSVEVEHRSLSKLSYYKSYEDFTISFSERIKEYLEKPESSIPFFLASTEF